MSKLEGSDLTRAMLEHDAQEIWCAVCDESDERAMTELCGNDFTAYIVSFHDGYFYCTGGMPWKYAVPIKISAVMQCEVAV